MNRKVMSLIVDGISLSVIGLLVFFYSLYSYRFAVTSLQPSFLNFPVFIGEIVLGVCLTLLIVKYVVNRTPIKFNRNIYIGIAFLIFIFIKTAYGYVKWGPLALRNSALFYYFLYAVIGYSIYNRGFLKNRIIQYTLLFLFTAVIILRYNHKTFFFTHIMLAMVFFSEMKNKTVRNILIIVFIILGYEGIKITLVGGRDIMVSSFIAYAFIFVVLMGGFLCSKIKGNHKLAIVGTFFLITAVIFIWKIHNFDNVKSLSEWGLLLERYKNISQIIEKKESTFEYSNPPVKIYDTTRDRKRNVKVIPQLPFGLKLFGNMEQKRAVTTAVSVKNDAPREKTNTAVYSKDAVPSEKIVAVVATVPQGKTEGFSGLGNNALSQEKMSTAIDSNKEVNEKQVTKEKEGRAVYSSSLDNLLFRILIGKEMLEEGFKEKKVFGADFGKPFRSKSIDILNWDSGWKTRSGWVEPHNSTINMIYRAGIIGLTVMIMLWIIFIKMAGFFIKSRNIKGIFLSAALLYWMIIAYFSVILGIPYFAIPFWVLLGMTWRYFKDKKQELINVQRVSI